MTQASRGVKNVVAFFLEGDGRKVGFGFLLGNDVDPRCQLKWLFLQDVARAVSFIDGS